MTPDDTPGGIPNLQDGELRAAPSHHDWTSLIPLAAGLFWLVGAPGFAWLLFGFVPGALMLAGGVSLLLWPGEAKVTYYLALGAVLGVLLMVPQMFAGGFWRGALATLLAIAAYLVAGRSSLRLAPLPPGVPTPPARVAVWAKAALDEALMAYFIAFARIPSRDVAVRMCGDAQRFDGAVTAGGWLDDPAAFHRIPEAPPQVTTETRRWSGRSFEHVRFDSGFVPHPTLPGAELWSSHQANRECHLRVFRTTQPGRPWLLGIHGYRMGADFMDFRLFPPQVFCDKLAVNLVLPILPLHGPRRLGARSGDYFLDGDLLDLVHAETQSLWDLRRTVAWIRAQDPGARIGVAGYSLGGYNAALLAAHQSGLDFVIAGIPVCDFSTTLWDKVPAPHREYFASRGLDRERYERLLRPVSPLACAPQLPRERLFLFAGSADRVVVPAQPLALGRHWQREVDWYPGGHLTFRGESAMSRAFRSAFDAAGWSDRGAPAGPEEPVATTGTGGAAVTVGALD